MLQRANHEDRVRVEARAVCNYPLDCLEILCNGAVVRHVEGGGGATEIECCEDVTLKGSSWLAVRARGRVEPAAFGGTAAWNLHAHTSPVYVHLDQAPISVPADLTAMADCVRHLMVQYRNGKFDEAAQREEMEANARAALAFYENALARTRAS